MRNGLLNKGKEGEKEGRKRREGLKSSSEESQGNNGIEDNEMEAVNKHVKWFS